MVAASADLEALDAVMALVGERFGQIDVLFANAGVDGLTAVAYIPTGIDPRRPWGR